MNNEKTPAPAEPSGITPRLVIGGVVGVILIIFIIINRSQTEVSFIFFTAQTPLWVALVVAAILGFLGGVLFGRKRYKRP